MLEAGTVLGAKYRLQNEIGRGGMGSVWRATRLDLGTELAVKVMLADSSSQASKLDRFTREAKAAASLTSPHVVRIIDFGVDAAAGVAFMAMELLVGESLAERLATAGRQSPARVASIIQQVARALNQAHAAGIVHRDLKPANIFLVRNDDEELVKLLDFGIAKSGDGVSTATGSVLGTPHYMSPEQVGALKDVDHRTDIWSLGVIACECLTGGRPFAADTLPELAMKIALGRAELPSSLGPVPTGFDEWFARATNANRAQRFQSAGELSSALAALVARAVVGPTPAARELALAATLPSDAMDRLRYELPATATSVTVHGVASAGLSTTSGGGASVPSRHREGRPGSSVRRWLIAAAVLGVGGVGVRYGLLSSSTRLGEPMGATEPAKRAEPPEPRPLERPNQPNEPTQSAPRMEPPVAAPPRLPEDVASAAGPRRPATRTTQQKPGGRAPRASRPPARDDTPLNAYDTQ